MSSMNIFVVIFSAMCSILVLLRMRKPIGWAMLAGSLCVWALRGAQLDIAVRSVYEVFQMPRTYELIFALYFVMCLEMQLRLSGAFEGTLHALGRWFKSDRLSIGLMPAILGMLPSLGGAIFSAPMVNSLGDKLQLNAEQKSSINFWYRHIAEYCSPIQPGLLVTAVILNVPMHVMLGKIWLLAILAAVLGWIFCMPSKSAEPKVVEVQTEGWQKDFKNTFFTLFPVLFNLVFVVMFKIDPATSMGVVVLLMFVMLAVDGRAVSVWKTLRGAFDYKLLINVSCIILFIQILQNTGTLKEIVASFAHTSLSKEVVIATVSFLIGMLTGISQGHAAMIMPIVASLSPQDPALLGALAFVAGVTGQMLTPTHLCLVVTVDYFKADYIKTLKPILIMQFLVLTAFVVWQYAF